MGVFSSVFLLCRKMPQLVPGLRWRLGWGRLWRGCEQRAAGGPGARLSLLRATSYLVGLCLPHADPAGLGSLEPTSQQGLGANKSSDPGICL